MPTSRRFRQTITVQVTTKELPLGVVSRALRASSEIADYDVQEVGDIEEVPGLNRKRLIELAVWVAGENAKQEMGLPSEWHQAAWLSRRQSANSCGTACCIAGKVALADGGIPLRDERGDWATVDEGLTTVTAYFPHLDAERSVDEYAQEVLGLTRAQAGQLFEGANDYEKMINLIREFLAEEGGDRPRRRLRAGDGRPCSRGESCSQCYEDVPADDPASLFVF